MALTLPIYHDNIKFNKIDRGEWCMKFTIETVYDQKAMTAMVRALRKTVNKKRSKRTHRFGMIAIILGLFLLFSADAINFRLVITLTVVAVIVLALIFEDAINAYFTRKRGLPGLEKAVVTFHENGYHSVTALGESDFYYNTIQCFIECGDYFIFAFGPSHGQVYNKRNITGGTAEDFSAFITEKTGKQLEVA